MKKLMPLLLIAILLPQVAFAAWWNPFSWRIFQRGQNKFEILENRVKELEGKLENTTPTNTATSTKFETSSKPVIKPPQSRTEINTPTKVENGGVSYDKQLIGVGNYYKDTINSQLLKYINQSLGQMDVTETVMIDLRDSNTGKLREYHQTGVDLVQAYKAEMIKRRVAAYELLQTINIMTNKAGEEGRVVSIQDLKDFTESTDTAYNSIQKEVVVAYEDFFENVVEQTIKFNSEIQSIQKSSPPTVQTRSSCYFNSISSGVMTTGSLDCY